MDLLHVIRDPLIECTHRGHAAVWRHGDGLVTGWGDVTGRILPRSAMKMMQALPLVESGAARAAGLSDIRLALSCASHRGRGDPHRHGHVVAGRSRAVRARSALRSADALGRGSAPCHDPRPWRAGPAAQQLFGQTYRFPDPVEASPRRARISRDRPSRAAGNPHRGRGADGGDLRQLRHRRLFRSELRAVTGRLRARPRGLRGLRGHRRRAWRCHVTARVRDDGPSPIRFGRRGYLHPA